MEVAGIPISDSLNLLDQQDVNSSLKIYREVFDLCDRDGNGFITKDELAHICEQASSECVVSGILDNVLLSLEPNHEGHISFDVFKSGFQSFQHMHDAEYTPPMGRFSPNQPSYGCNGSEEVYMSDPVLCEQDGAWMEVADRIDPQNVLAGTGVEEMWKNLFARDPTLVENFEGFLSEVIGELKQSDHEKNSLENHIKKIMEQHSREVSEMDNLLQEELQLVKDSHLQNNASQTSRLSNHYSSLLAQREAVIGEMTSQEKDLKQALHHRTVLETQLLEDKNYLLSVNQDLHEQLVTTLQSGPTQDHIQGRTEAKQPRSEVSVADPSHLLDPESGLSISRPLAMPPNSLDLESNSYAESEVAEINGIIGVMEPDHIGLDQELAVCQDSSNCLNVVHEVPEEEEEGNCVPKNSLAHGNHPESAEEAIDGNKTAQCQLHSTPIFDTKLPGGGFPRRTGAGPPTECSSESVVYPPKSVLQESGSTAQMVSDFSLTISGVMPRRDDLPRPSLHHINRVFKVVFLGDSGVGKTSVITRLTEGKFTSAVVSTVGLDYSIKILHVGTEKVVFQLWDTAGQEKFGNILTPVYFRRADAFVIVYDVSDQNTFRSIKKWISILKAALREQPRVIMLIGNKSDKTKEQRCVSIEDGRKLALTLQAMFSETSALSGDNILQAHSTLANLLLGQQDSDLMEFKKLSAARRENDSNKCSC